MVNKSIVFVSLLAATALALPVEQAEDGPAMNFVQLTAEDRAELMGEQKMDCKVDKIAELKNALNEAMTSADVWTSWDADNLLDDVQIVAKDQIKFTYKKSWLLKEAPWLTVHITPYTYNGYFLGGFKLRKLSGNVVCRMNGDDEGDAEDIEYKRVLTECKEYLKAAKRRLDAAGGDLAGRAAAVADLPLSCKTQPDWSSPGCRSMCTAKAEAAGKLVAGAGGLCSVVFLKAVNGGNDGHTLNWHSHVDLSPIAKGWLSWLLQAVEKFSSNDFSKMCGQYRTGPSTRRRRWRL